MGKKLFIVVNVDWFFLSHRLPIALAAKKAGYDVTVYAIEEEGKGNEIRGYGLNFVPLPSSRGGTNILNELVLLLFLWKEYFFKKPSVIHHVAIKPVLYGSLAAKFTFVKRVINAVSGMGSNFIGDKKGLNHTIIQKLYASAVGSKKNMFIVQNEDDKQLLLDFDETAKDRLVIIEGSGVDLDYYAFTPKQNTSQPLKIILPARMLKDKGIYEFVQAAQIIKQQYVDVNAQFILCGKLDKENPTAITEAEINEWQKNNMVTWIGHQTNMRAVLQNADIVVLPSYREGLPKVLIEACAVGNCIVTTNVPGCKSVVQNNVNGFLVGSKNSQQLAEAIYKLCNNKSLREEFAKNGRKIAEQKFSIQSVIDKTLSLYEYN